MGIDNIPFRNMGTGADGKPNVVAQVCYMCAGKRQHDNMNYYVQKRPDGPCELSTAPAQKPVAERGGAPPRLPIKPATDHEKATRAQDRTVAWLPRIYTALGRPDSWPAGTLHKA